MNIYFSCSITGGRQDQSIYQEVVQFLLENGHDVPTARLADANVQELESALSAIDVYRRDISWIDACDVMIAEVSTPSHGVGYEIAYALLSEKPVLCIYQNGRKVSKMLLGNVMPKLQIEAYMTLQDAINMVKEFLKLHNIGGMDIIQNK